MMLIIGLVTLCDKRKINSFEFYVQDNGDKFHDPKRVSHNLA